MAAPSAPVIGLNGKAYYNSASYGTPTWVLTSNVGDINVTDEMNTSQIQVRSQSGFEVTIAGLRKVAFEFSMVYDQADAAQTAFRTAYAARTKTDFLFLDQATGTAGSSGLRVQGILTKFARQEKINEAMMVDVKIEPTYDSTNAPVAAYTAS
jgi:hypothetical protein